MVDKECHQKQEQYAVGYTGKSGWRKFFTKFYWRLQWMRIKGGQPPLNILEVVTFEVPDDIDSDPSKDE